MCSLKLNLSAANIALFLLFSCACFHSCAKYFYFYYRLLFGSLYPAYSSYKAIKNKDIREYSRWMMYWIVFAIFSFCEIFADIFIGIWLPFYYETKILFVLWLMSPYGNGARIMYKHLIHPELNKREHIIDEYITSAKELGVSSIWHLYRKISAFINKIMLQFIQMIHTAMFNQLQRNVYNIQPEQSKQMVNSRPLLTQPNLFQWMMNASTSVVKTENQESQQLNSNVQPVASNDSTINNPLYQRWFSEEALNIVEIDQSMISNEIINVRSLSESETNLDDWEKMDATENVADLDNACDKLNNKSTKPKIKRSRNVKITTTPVRRTTRAAAVKARAKAKVQDLDEDN